METAQDYIDEVLTRRPDEVITAKDDPDLLIPRRP